MNNRGFRSNTVVIIPVWNEEAVIRKVVESVLRVFDTVICVNDGSRDASAQEIAKTKAILINHPINMGQGAALQTGLEYARTLPHIQYFVHFDADGQHDLSDVQRMLRTIGDGGADVVLGSRFLERDSRREMPLKKKLLLRMAVVYTRMTTGLNLTDAHNGLRVFSRAAADVLNMTMPDYAHASEILMLIRRHRLRYVEVPVTIHYTEYSKSKGQSILNAVNIIYDMMVKGGR